MENYIYVNGKKIGLTDEQVQQIISAHKGNNQNARLADIPAGGTFKVDGMEFVVLEQNGETTAVITQNVLETTAFGSTNNFDGSDADDYCKEFTEDVFEKIGTENVVEHTVDLTSDDGLKDYGTVNRMVSLLTADRYRKYVDVLDKHKPDKYWWLATPYSTERHGSSAFVKCVSPSGLIFRDNYSSYDNGVRPFCILKSSIFVSV